MADAAKSKGNVWCAGCLTDYIRAAGKARARRILIRVVKKDYRVKTGVCKGCGKTRLTIDLGRKGKRRPKPGA